MQYVHKLLDYSFYLFFGMMLCGGFMFVFGLLSFVLTFWHWSAGFYWLGQIGGTIFGVGFWALWPTTFIGILTGYLK